MMKRIAVIFLMVISLFGCSSLREGMSQSEPTVRFLRTKSDGSIIVRVSSNGRNYVDALGLAQRYALRRVLFYGVSTPDNSSLSKPLISEVNAEEKYQSFFEQFFSDNGDYRSFASSRGKRLGSSSLTLNRESVKIVTTMTIHRSDLKRYLEENNIIHP